MRQIIIDSFLSLLCIIYWSIIRVVCNPKCVFKPPLQLLRLLSVLRKAVNLLLMSNCFMCLLLFLGLWVWFLLCYAVLCFLSSFAIILMGKRDICLTLFYWFCVTVSALWFFFMILWFGRYGVIVVFTDLTHLFFWCHDSCVCVWRLP